MEYGTAAVSTVLLGTVGKLLGLGAANRLGGYPFDKEFDHLSTWIPGFGLLGGGADLLLSLLDGDRGEAAEDALILSGSAGGAVGGWFAGRAIGKKLRKKLGL